MDTEVTTMSLPEGSLDYLCDRCPYVCTHVCMYACMIYTVFFFADHVAVCNLLFRMEK
jgi:hypothetical protein